MQFGPIGTRTPAQAKFTADAAPIGLRLQAALLVKDDEGRVAALRLDDDPNGYVLPVELLNLNEAPDEAATRIAQTWFASPLKDVRLASVQSYPATGPEDNKWYLVFLYEARAEGELKGTPDTVEIKFAAPGKAPGAWRMAHGDVWERVE